MATKIDKAVAWAVAIAESPDHGYDQGERWGPDYDCSSFVITAWEEAGVPVKTNGARRTSNMVPKFIETGFRDVTAKVNLSTGEGLQKGDVLWRTGHTEMMCSSDKRVGAHSSENLTIYGEPGDQTGKEIDVRKYGGTWEKVLRYPGGSSEFQWGVTKEDVTTSNEYLERSEMLYNALYITAWLVEKGWTFEAIGALLGNLESESTMNPGIWESLNEGNLSGGFGLVQWTPATKFIDWCTLQGYSNPNDIDAQLERLIWEMDNGVQYYATEDYPETFREFSQSEKDPEYLACAFVMNYERPASPDLTERSENARYWYDIICNIDLPAIEPIHRKQKAMSLIMMYIATRRRF